MTQKDRVIFLRAALWQLIKNHDERPPMRPAKGRSERMRNRRYMSDLDFIRGFMTAMSIIDPSVKDIGVSLHWDFSREDEPKAA